MGEGEYPLEETEGGSVEWPLIPADEDAAVGGGGDMESTDIWLGDGSHSSVATAGAPPPTPTPMPPLRDRFTGLNINTKQFIFFC